MLIIPLSLDKCYTMVKKSSPVGVKVKRRFQK